MAEIRPMPVAQIRRLMRQADKLSTDELHAVRMIEARQRGRYVGWQLAHVIARGMAR